MKTLVFFLTGILLSKILVAQNIETSHFSYTKEDGLPSNLVYGSLLDKDGLLWICTDGGVIQFDGNHSHLYTAADGLPSTDVYHMFCDSKNRIWFTTLNNEISYCYNGKIYNKKNNSLISKINSKGTFPRYYEDLNQNVWVRFSPFELYRISENGIINISNINPRGDCNYVLFLPDSTIYFSTSDSSFIVDISKGNITGFKSKDYKIVKSISILKDSVITYDFNNLIQKISYTELKKHSIALNGSENNIFEFNNGVYCTLDGSIKILYPFSNNRFQYSEILTTVDNSNPKFAGTYRSGLFVSNVSGSVNYLNHMSISTLFKNKNKLLLGSNKGTVIAAENNGLNQNKTIKFNNKFSHSKVSKLVIRSDKILCGLEQSLYVYGSNGTIRVVTPPRYMDQTIKNLYIDNDTILCLYSSGVYRIKNYNEFNNIDSFTNFKRAYSYVNYKNQKLVGTQDSLMIIDKSYHPYFLKNPFSKRIMDLQTNGDLLFALTAENGLYIIRDHQVIKNINHETGLSSNNCGRSFLYKNELFISTDNGISVVDVNTFNTTFVFESDGLASNMVNDLLIENDTLYAATEEGLSIIPVSSIIRNKEFNLFAKPYAVKKDTVWDKPQEIVARTNQDITLVLNGTSYIKNTKKIYYYRIAELDSTFVSTLEKNILLNFHQTGHFHLEAYCVNAEGTKSKFLVIPIYIKPYFYQTIWFYLLLLALLVALIYFISRYYARLAKEKEQQKAAEEKRIRGLEIAAWRAGVNPHFLFNSLNGLQAFFRRNEFDKGNIYLSNFTQMLRNTVDTSNDLTLTVEEEIEYLREFLQFEQKKRDEKFEFFITYDTVQTLDYFIPSMVVQPVLENSLKHALSATKENIFTVNFRVEGERLVCVIADNGPGIRKTNREVRKSVGIALIRYKLRIIQKIINDPIEFFMKNRMDANHKPAGLETTFIFPLLTKRLKIDNEVDAENESKLIFEDSEENPNPPPPEEDSI